MAPVKRIFLFLALNMLVVLTLSTLLQVLGIGAYATRHGLDYGSLMVFCLVWGMGGAGISLALSRIMAKRMLGVQSIDPACATSEQAFVARTVARLAQQAGLPVTPEVGVYVSPEVNAFATGPSRSRALVAVSTGLLQQMDAPEIEAVLAHEVSHVANGDMVTMTLLQGVVNAFAMFLARAIAFALAQSMRDNREARERGPSPMLTFAIQMLLEMVFMVLGSLVVAWFSRHREYRADAGAASLAGSTKMIGALQRLRATVARVDPAAGQAALQTLKISGQARGPMAWFASHPPLEARIARLRAA